MSAFDPAYMDRRALMYMREWMSNSLGDEGAVEGDNFVTMHRRMQWAGLVRDYDGEMSTMSPLGMYVVDILSRRSYNFFPLTEIMDIWPVAWLETASAHAHKVREMPSQHTVINFLALFQLEFPLDMDVRNYVRERIRADQDSGGADPMFSQDDVVLQLPEQLVSWPELTVDFTKASDAAGDFDEGLEMSTGDLSRYLQSHRADYSDAADTDGAAASSAEAERCEWCGGIPGSNGCQNPHTTPGARGEPCTHCEGSGHDPFDPDTLCPVCGGSGRLIDGDGQGPDEAAGTEDEGISPAEDEDDGFSI